MNLARDRFCRILALACALLFFEATTVSGAERLPNIVICIADDWSYPHASALGDPVVRTPNIDRIAREGAIFKNAFCAAPSCTPSRAALLTGRAPHQLGAGGNLWGLLPKEFPVFSDQLESAGYTSGLVRKGWGPGNFQAGGRARNPAGTPFKDVPAFFERAPKDKPLVLWAGSADPHRPYEKGSGAASGLDATKVRVPAYWPDNAAVRSDILDYYLEVQRFDEQVGEVIRHLEERGELDNTVFIITSDNGMPFPRSKANLYDGGSHVPLIIRYPGKVRAGMTIDAFVNLYDLAPTILEAAGLRADATAPGRSLWPTLAGKNERDRDAVFIERERHANVRAGDLSYPSRAIRTADWLYIVNYRTDRWPVGDPEVWMSVGAYGDCDEGPTKTEVLKAGGKFKELSFGKRPTEELYDLRRDPDQVVNVTGQAQHASIQKELRARLNRWMKQTSDPRLEGGGDEFDSYPYFGTGPAEKGRPVRR